MEIRRRPEAWTETWRNAMMEARADIIPSLNFRKARLVRLRGGRYISGYLARRMSNAF